MPHWVGLGERRLWWQMEMGEHGVKEREAILEHGVWGNKPMMAHWVHWAGRRKVMVANGVRRVRGEGKLWWLMENIG